MKVPVLRNTNVTLKKNWKWHEILTNKTKVKVFFKQLTIILVIKKLHAFIKYKDTSLCYTSLQLGILLVRMLYAINTDSSVERDMKVITYDKSEGRGAYFKNLSLLSPRI